VNGGGPLAASLRALRHEPMLVDDVAVVPALAGAAGGLGLDVEELVRWTRAWLIVWQGALQARGAIGTLPPWTVAVSLADVPTLKGDPDQRRRTAALELLDRAGLIRLNGDRTAGTLAESAFAVHRAGLEVDWGALGRAVRHEPAPLLVARALSELIVPAGEPTPVALRDLAERSGYALKQVRVALRRLVEVGLVSVSESSGAATRYWFESGARVQAERPREAVPLPIAPAALATPSPAARAVEPRRAPRVAVRMTLNGVTFGIGAGLAPHVELGPDGIPHVTFDVPDVDE